MRSYANTRLFCQRLILLWLLLSCFSWSDASGQSRRRAPQQRFRAGLLLGGNFSQVDGDKYNGYHKASLLMGLQASAVLSRQSELGVELLYLRKGSKTETSSSLSSVKGLRNRHLDFQYAAVPLYLRYRWKKEGPSGFVEGGFSYARIVGIRITEPSSPTDGLLFRDIEGDLQRNEFSILAGLGQEFTKNLGLKLRYSIALNKLYENPEPPPPRTLSTAPPRIDYLRNYYWALMVFYRF
ncbi:MAG: PorT family protein [Phaeodactylibacter sp.]|nr:PorT family protein [Phaeodactylibacter sp.]MCB9300336.1 PorT family protein [Lewinellaceae bacterium]HQU57910.1 porin family protein [Saprospiraceae bacterium]